MISGRIPIMPSGCFRSRDRAHTVSALRRASPQLRIPLEEREEGFPEQCPFPRQVTLPRHLAQLSENSTGVSMEYRNVASMTGQATDT